LTFKTAVWQDEATEQFHARIFVEVEGIDLQAWGLMSDYVRPIDLSAPGLRGPNGLGQMCEAALQLISPDFPMTKFKPQFLGRLTRNAPIAALLEAKLAQVAV
jgi:hypothetical protein